MKSKKIAVSLIVVICVTWIVAVLYYGKLPEKIPSHWNIDGEINGYMTKPWGVYMFPLMSTVLSVILWFLPKVAPKGFKLDSARKAYNIIIFVMSVFLFAIMVMTFEAALDNTLNTTQFVFTMVGALFVIIGNYLSKVPKNFFFGIRTPWTLSSDKVWYQTHRVGSWIFIVCGMLVIFSSLMGVQQNYIVVLLMSAGLLPVIYSLFSYYKIEGFNNKKA